MTFRFVTDFAGLGRTKDVKRRRFELRTKRHVYAYSHRIFKNSLHVRH